MYAIRSYYVRDSTTWEVVTTIDPGELDWCSGADGGLITDIAIDTMSPRWLVAFDGGRVALVEQNGLRAKLPCGGKDDPPVRQVMRREVVTCLRRNVVGDDPAQTAGLEAVFPDVPGRLIVVVERKVQVYGSAHREQDGRTVERDLSYNFV